MDDDLDIEFVGGDEDAWFAMLERGDFEVIWEAEAEKISRSATQPLNAETH